MNRLSRKIALCAPAANYGVPRPIIGNALFFLRRVPAWEKWDLSTAATCDPLGFYGSVRHGSSGLHARAKVRT
jgi:hypothetical protein